MSILQTCLDEIQKIDPGGKLCRAELCMSPYVFGTLERLCHCIPPVSIHPCPYGPGSPLPVFDEATNEICFCCCDVRMNVSAGADGDVDVSGVWVGQMVRVAKRAN
jgi:hypothetical protein